jgi:hypothetical protein
MTVAALYSNSYNGIRDAVGRFESHAGRLAGGEIDAENTTGLLREERAVEANLATMRAADEMVGTLLDVLA